MDVDPSSSSAAPSASFATPSRQKPAVTVPLFDLESYISNYTGHTRIARLLFIGDKLLQSTNDGDRADGIVAFQMALTELKHTTNTDLYKDVAVRMSGRLGAAYELDQAWVDATDADAARTKEKLESELASYRSTLIRESIRMAYEYLRDFHYKRGDLTGALKLCNRMESLGTSTKHVLDLCLNRVQLAIELKNWILASQFIAKVENTEADPVTTSKISAAAGLSFLCQRNYQAAAQRFIVTSADLGSSFSDVLSGQDVAVYGALCGLATFSRAEVKAMLTDNQTFKQLLELVPHVREMINLFYLSKYDRCLAILDGMRAEAQLDIYLSDHFAELYTAIRNNCLTQYTTPFLSVDLNRMAAAFNTTVGALIKELEALIMNGLVRARIDSHKNVLHAMSTDVRESAYARVAAAGSSVTRSTETLLRRVSAIRNDLQMRRSGPAGALMDQPFDEDEFFYE